MTVEISRRKAALIWMLIAVGSLFFAPTLAAEPVTETETHPLDELRRLGHELAEARALSEHEDALPVDPEWIRELRRRIEVHHPEVQTAAQAGDPVPARKYRELLKLASNFELQATGQGRPLVTSENRPGTPDALSAGRSPAAGGNLGTLAGTVTDSSDDSPLSGIEITAFDGGGFYAGAGFTDSLGQYQITGLQTGEYFVRVETYGIGYLQQIYDGISCTGPCPLTDGTPVFVPADQTVDGIDFALVEGSTLSGRIRDQDTGEALAGVQVEVLNELGQALVSATTDPAGRYTVNGIAAGTYRARASHEHYLTELWPDVPCGTGCDVSSGTPIVVGTGDAVPGIDFHLRVVSALEGTVTRSSDGQPIAYAYVTAYDSLGDPVKTVDADGSGDYRIGGLEPGDYFVTAGQYDFTDELWNDIPCPASCDPTIGDSVTVLEDQVTPNIDFALDPYGSVSGTITRTDGGSGPVTVGLYNAAGALLETDYASGDSYLIDDVPAGTAFVAIVEGYAYKRQVWDGRACPGDVCDPTSGDPVTIQPGLETTGIDFALDPKAEIRGRITDELTGLPIHGADVTAYDHQGFYVDNAYTEPDGTYQVRGLDAGTYYLRASFYNGTYVDEVFDDLPCEPGPCAVLDGDPIPVADGAQVDDVDFALTQKPQISGTLTDLVTGENIDDAWVIAYHADGSLARFGNVDGTGYQVDSIDPGTYFLVAGGDRHVPQLWDGTDCFPSPGEGGCDVTTGTPVVVDYNLRATVDVTLDPGGRIQGSLTASDPSAGSLYGDLFVYDGSGSLIRSLFSLPPSGDWEVSGLVSGDYYVIGRGGFGYRDEVWPGLPCEPDSGCSPTDGSAVSVTRGSSTLGIDLALESYGRIHGQVLLDGVSTSGATVYVYDSEGQQVTSDYASGGTYSIYGLAPGSYFLATRYTQDYLDEVFGGGLCENICDPTAGTPVAVALSEDVTGPTFDLDPASGLRGQVTDLATGLPLPGVAVDVWTATGTWHRTTVTDVDGRYSVGLSSADYYVTTDNGLGFVDEVWNNVPCPDGPAYEGLCDPLSGQSVETRQDEPYLDASFALAGPSTMFEDGFENGLGSWTTVVTPDP